MNKARLIGIGRLRLGSDGHGITTLVAFHGCPLHCRYCLNPQCLQNDYDGLVMTPDEVLETGRKEELYYWASKGGLTFGGGEPLMNAEFIREVLELGAKEWHTTIETSLNVPLENVKILLPYIDEYIVDVKDMNPEIYQSYTGKGNERVIENLKWLVEQGMSESILCKIPGIDGFNNEIDQNKSKKILERMGLKRFHLFEYITG